MNTLTIPLDDIELGERLREVDGAFAALLAESMAESGQMTPIEVREGHAPGKYILVAGGHRLAALRLAGFSTAEANLFTGTELQARLREIDENLIRHELTQLDRATFLAERKDIYEALHPEARHGGATKTKSFSSFADDVAERMGVSARLIQLAVARHQRMHPDVRRRLVGTWLANHGAQLDALARALPSEQMRAVELLFGDLAEGATRPGSVGEALAAVRGVRAPDVNADDAAVDAFLRLWRRASAAARRRIQGHVAGGRA